MAKKNNNKNKKQNQQLKPLILNFPASPDKVIEIGRNLANQLADIVNKRKLFTVIAGKKFVHVEGWTTMGAMLGVFPTIVYTKKIGNPNEEITWEARAVLKTINGKEIVQADAMCSSKERNWKNRDEFAIRSMAQTRAIGKCYRLAFAWIIKLAGYEPVPYEEIEGQEEFKNNNKGNDRIFNLVLKGIQETKNKEDKLKIIERALKNPEFTNEQKTILKDLKSQLKK